jgi:hypothetical protein
VNAAGQTIGDVHGDGADGVLTEVQSDLKGEVFRTGIVDGRIVETQSGQEVGQMTGRKLNVDNRSHDLLDDTVGAFHDGLLWSQLSAVSDELSETAGWKCLAKARRPPRE